MNTQQAFQTFDTLIKKQKAVDQNSVMFFLECVHNNKTLFITVQKSNTEQVGFAVEDKKDIYGCSVNLFTKANVFEPSIKIKQNIVSELREIYVAMKGV